MRTSTPPATGSGTTRTARVSKKRVSRGSRLVAIGIPAPFKCTTTVRPSPVTAYSRGRSLRTVTMPPAEGRKPIPVIDVRVRAGAALAATGAGEGDRAGALAGGVGGVRALGGGGFATIETVGSEARARSTSSRDAPLSACATRWGAGFGAAATGAVAGAGEGCAAGGVGGTGLGVGVGV